MRGEPDAKKSVCMPVFSYYPFDPRVRRVAEALSSRGYDVDVICLRGEAEEPEGTYNGVNIYRLPLSHRRGGYLRYLYSYGMMFMLAFFKLNSLDSRKRYDVIHVHSLPDFLVFIALLGKRRGARIVLDLHEAMPEIFAARFGKKMDSPLVKIPIFLERISQKLADRVITVNETIKELYTKRGTSGEKITVIMNSPDEKLGQDRDLGEFEVELDLKEKFTLVFVGGINYERNIEVIFRAMAKLETDIPDHYFILLGHMYGHKGQSYKDQLRALVGELGLSDRVYIGGKLDPEDVLSYLNLADYGIVSYLRNPLTDMAVPNKVFEYIALDKPIIVCRLKALHSLLGDDAALYYKPEDADDLADRMLRLYRHRNELGEMKKKATEVYERCKWNVMKKRLYDMYDKLLARAK